MAVGQVDPVVRFVRRIAASAGPGGLTDGQLLQRYLAGGSEAAFDGLVQRHGRMVHAVCRRTLGNVHDADDAYQATFFLLMRNASRIVRHESVGSWLHGVAYRTALRARKAMLRRREQERRAGESAAAEAPPDISWRELRPILDQEIDRLPEKYRLPFVLCYLEGKTNSEAAQQLCWPLGTVATRLARARARLRNRLTRRGAGLAVTLAAALESSTAFAQDATVRGTACKVDFQGTLSVRAAALVKGGMIAMGMNKLRSLILAVICVGIAVASAGLLIERFALADQARAAVPDAASRETAKAVNHGQKREPGQEKLVPSYYTVEMLVKCITPDGEEIRRCPRICVEAEQPGRLIIGRAVPMVRQHSTDPAVNVVEYMDIGTEMGIKIFRCPNGRVTLDFTISISEPGPEGDVGNTTVIGQFARCIRTAKLGELVRFEMPKAGSPGQVCKLELRVTETTPQLQPPREQLGDPKKTQPDPAPLTIPAPTKK
jgi:RNA polymerase sigma factor (sigma-70 family)